MCLNVTRSVSPVSLSSNFKVCEKEKKKKKEEEEARHSLYFFQFQLLYSVFAMSSSILNAKRVFFQSSGLIFMSRSGLRLLSKSRSTAPFGCPTSYFSMSAVSVCLISSFTTIHEYSYQKLTTLIVK